jgi:hypothetical protein
MPWWEMGGPAKEKNFLREQLPLALPGSEVSLRALFEGHHRPVRG